MRALFVIVTFLTSFTALSQSINLSDPESVKEFLDETHYQLGDYGSVFFKYDKYDKDFGKIVFDAMYLLPGGKKPVKVLFKAEIMIANNDFISPSFVRSFVLRNPNSFVIDNYNYPLVFELYDNGELYYQEKLHMEKSEYILSRKSGQTFKNIPPYKLAQKITN
jgi:hypothetical protein